MVSFSMLIKVLARRKGLFKIYDDDVFLVSYPRSGNTWMRNLIANMRHPEKELGFSDVNRIIPDMYKCPDLGACEPPRVIKSHEPYQNRYPRVIYIYRDARDVLVSYYRLFKSQKNYQKPFKAFVHKVLDGGTPFGSWQEHVSSWMFRKHGKPFLPLRYEDLYGNTIKEVRKVTGFLGMDLDDSDIEKAIGRSTIRKQNESFLSVYPQLRPDDYKGDVELKSGSGKWVEFFDEELLDFFWSRTQDVMLKLGYEK